MTGTTKAGRLHAKTCFVTSEGSALACFRRARESAHTLADLTLWALMPPTLGRLAYDALRCRDDSDERAVGIESVRRGARSVSSRRQASSSTIAYTSGGRSRVLVR